MKTNVYIDGFNFYYRCVRGTPYKWLNLAEFARGLLKPPYTLHRIRYYTALVKSRPGDLLPPVRQQVFLRALATLPEVSIHLGHFLDSKVWMKLVNPPPARAQVFKSEEKGSDVNLATDLLLDAFRGDYEAAFVVSCDSDLLRPIQVVKKEFRLPVGIALLPNGKSAVLTKEADFLRRVRPGLLQASQFPDSLTDANGTFTKPATW